MSSGYNPGSYEILLHDVLYNGVRKEDRTGTGTRSLFGRQLRYDLSRAFPLITTKKVHWKSVAVELMWLLRGETDLRYLHKYDVTIWDEWADENGDLGPVYGKQWRHWDRGYPDYEAIDQITNVIDSIRFNPDSRRHIVSAWNVADIEDMALPPCHAFFQFYVADGKLSCQLYQRSADMFLGVPFNIASYALLTHIIAQQTGLDVGEFVWTGGDVHIYDNHVAQVEEQLTRTLRPLPKLVMPEDVVPFDAYEWDDFSIVGYDPWPAIKGAVAV